MKKQKQNSDKREMLYMAAKSGSTKIFKLALENGEEKEYTFQHPGVREGLKLRGRAKNQFGHLDEELYFGELMKYVIVQPKTNWDYWEENEGMMQVMQEASSFLNG